MLASRAENIATNNGKTYEGNILNIRQTSPSDRPFTPQGNKFPLKCFFNKTHHPVITGSLLLHTAPTPPCTPCPRAGRRTLTARRDHTMSSQEPKSPLTTIAIFAGIIEASALASLPFLGESSQSIYTWFLVGFPPFLTLLFFLTLNFNTKSLYGPDEHSGTTETPENNNVTQEPSSITSSTATPLLLLPTASQISEVTISTVVISGSNAQILLELLARHAVTRPSSNRLILQNLEAGTHTTIITEWPNNHCN